MRCLFLQSVYLLGEEQPVSGVNLLGYSNDVQELTDKGLVCKRAKGNEYTVSDDRWVLEFYNEHKNDDVPTLVHAVMTNEQMWGQDLTKVPGFEEATVKNLTNIRENGALAAYASCL